MINTQEILSTIRMIQEDKLDIRTITLGVSLLDCAGATPAQTAQNAREKVLRMAGGLTRVGDEIQREFGIPIINKRVAVTPVSLVTQEPEPVALALDDAAAQIGIDFLGGYSALVHKGMTPAEQRLIESLPDVLAQTHRLNASVNVGTTRAGVNMDAVARMGEIIRRIAARTADRDGLGCAKLVVFCNAVEDNPFMAGAFHGVGEGDTAVNVGVSGPGVVKRALEQVRGQPLDVVAEAIKKTAFQVTRMGQLVAREASRRLGAPFGIVDLSLAPTPAIGDSVAHILTEMGLEFAGAPGTTAALALLNDAVKKGGVMASSRVGGLSGAFIPVSEDIGMIEAVRAGALTLEKLEAMTCVCSVGLDMIALPGDTPAATIAGIIADEAAIGMVNNKTTACRLIPVPGKTVGEMVEFGGLLGRAPIIRVNPACCAPFIARGGHLPAPLHSLRN